MSPRNDPQFHLLGAQFSDKVNPARFPEHVLRFRNRRHDRTIGLGDLDDAAWIRHFGAFEPLKGNLERPIAMRYHGHQFRQYNPDIGDGRGFLFAQLRDNHDRLLDIATKGSGRTPYSRSADGRLTLKGGVREVLAATMLEARGVKTSKAFSLIETGEALQRQDEPSPTRSAVLVRLGHSHIRFGTFQRHAYEGNDEALMQLVQHGIACYYPRLMDVPDDQKPVALLEVSCKALARLGAQWMTAGFVHGVLNTDNVVITGESFDYGPWRFLPTLDPSFTAAYFDYNGLYAYGRQPAALLWNCRALAAALATLERDHERLTAALDVFEPTWRRAMREMFFLRLGIRPSDDADADLAFVDDTMTMMHDQKLPFEAFFLDHFGGRDRDRHTGKRKDIYAASEVVNWQDRFRDYVPESRGLLEHTYFQRPDPADMLIDEVEDIWSAIADHDNWTPFEMKCAELNAMIDARLMPHGDSQDQARD